MKLATLAGLLVLGCGARTPIGAGEEEPGPDSPDGGWFDPADAGESSPPAPPPTVYPLGTGGWADAYQPSPLPTQPPPAPPLPQPDPPPDPQPDPPPPPQPEPAPLPCVFVLTNEEQIYVRRPSSTTYEHVGTVSCGSSSTANSMTVSRFGSVAYVAYHDGSLYQVDTDTAECDELGLLPVAFVKGIAVGTGRAADGQEILYAAYEGYVYAVLPHDGYSVQLIGALPDSIYWPEIAGWGPGDLFAFVSQIEPGMVAQLDLETLEPLAVVELDLGASVRAWDFAPYYCVDCQGPNFLTFTSDDGVETTVTRVQMDPPLVEVEGTIQAEVIGAGTGVCPP